MTTKPGESTSPAARAAGRPVSTVGAVRSMEFARSGTDRPGGKELAHLTGNEIRTLHHRDVADPREHHDPAVAERARGPGRGYRVHQPVVAAVNDQRRRRYQRGIPPE